MTFQFDFCLTLTFPVDFFLTFFDFFLNLKVFYNHCAHPAGLCSRMGDCIKMFSAPRVIKRARSAEDRARKACQRAIFACENRVPRLEDGILVAVPGSRFGTSKLQT